MPLWGPVQIAPGRWRFRLWAPAEPDIHLHVEGRAPLAMATGGGGWLGVEAEARPGTRYRFLLPDGTAVPDPASRAQSGGVHGWSVVTDRGPRGNSGWRGRPWEEAVIMELHAGVLGGFAGVEADLPRLAQLGITAIELMPLGAFGGARNWGYDGVLPFAPAECYGSPGDLVRLVERAHDLGLMVLIDVVYNHFGPDGNYLGHYAPGFFHAEAETPWGGAVAVEKPPVAQFFLENAVMWLNDFGVDGLRFDAVHAIGNADFLDWLAQEIRKEVGDRHVHLILENEANDAERLKPGLYTAQWNDDFHNVLHVILTGESEGYYANFADHPTERLARCLAEGFVYQGEPTPTGEARGTPSSHLPPSAFVSFLQNHDQVGNRAMGERLVLLTGKERLRAATALLLLCPQIPLLFMGDEVASRSPFLFFTDFHNELADAVREGRRREFAKFAAFEDPVARARIPDPNDETTFHASRPSPGPDASEWSALIRSLLRLRAQHLAPGLAGCRSNGAQVLGDRAVSADWRLGDGSLLTLALNLGEQMVSFPCGQQEPFLALGMAGAPASFAAWLPP